MSLKLKLNTRPSAEGSPVTATPSAEPASAISTGGLKLKLNLSQPPTPASEHAPAAAPPTKKKPGPKKRVANEDISPAAKRSNTASGPTRKISIKPPPPTTPQSAGSIGRIKLGLNPRKSSAPKIRSINVKRPPPPRVPGVGYDSEDSEAEPDPAVQQAFVLRMQPGEDCDFLRESIATGRVGALASDGGVDVSIRFLDSHSRRAVVTVRGRRYAAALVDLPCIVETMKSWDRKGWWKVADVCQMLLVLGRCDSDEAVRSFALPREVDANTMQYAHGLTPPMQWVRKRRFRKRPSYRDMANVEEEVERLVREDEETTVRGGQVTSETMGRAEAERTRSQSQDYDDLDGDDDAVETVERDGDGDEYDDDADADADDGDVDLEGDLQAMFDMQDADGPSASTAAPVSEIVQSPAPLADQGATMSAVENAMADDSVAATPTGEHSFDEEDGEESDEDDDDDDDDDEESDEESPDVMDEDAQARAAERNQQLEEVADLEREVDLARRRAAGQKNRLLKEKALAQLATLEEELRTKRAVFGLDSDD